MTVSSASIADVIATIATSIWSSSGCLVVSDCSQRLGDYNGSH